ncbi:MAG: hypothetical protein HFI05_06520 [Lachnospiraceae bacterium]|jgi:hypothetical protein|nr:hypothetical protein [Lachnospiraceae bacterium]
MNEDTRKLLEECNSGCKMALGSMKQVKEYIQDEKLKKIVESYKQKHEQLEIESSNLLKGAGNSEKEPGVMASMFSWFTTEMKLMIEDDGHQIAKLMMDGCNMGIQSISEYQNKYKEASKEATELAKKLVKTEENFMQEMKQFL